MTTYSDLVAKLPTDVNRWVKGLAIASLSSQALLIVTGGAVRLTASGLGCPTWPRCTSESIVNTPEMGIHGIIEFGNRTLTFLLTAIALATLVAVWRMRSTRKDLFWLSVGLLAGIPAQAVVGGITVLTHLNPWVVGGHMLVSLALVAGSTVLVHRAWLTQKTSRERVSPTADKTMRQLLIAIGIFSAAALLLGVAVTGSGPHAGDANAPRNGLDPYLITRVHVLPVYLLVMATVVAVVLVYRRHFAAQLRSAVLLLAAAIVFQAAIGYIQHFTGLPIVLVGLHMLGAAALAAAATHLLYVGLTRQPTGRASGAAPALTAAAGHQPRH